jgi:phosphate:Na+ symporter
MAEWLVRLEPDAARMTADFHFAFNAVLALAFIGPLDGLAWLLVRLLPENRGRPNPADPIYLDEAAIAMPSVALACATRETLHTTSSRRCCAKPSRR